VYPTKYVAQAWSFKDNEFKFCDLTRSIDDLFGGIVYNLSYKLYDHKDRERVNNNWHFTEYEEALFDFARFVNTEELEVL